MKTSLILLILIAGVGPVQPPAGNPLYDFPGSIVQKNGSTFGYLNANLNDLATSGHYRESRAYEDSFAGPAAPVRLTLAHQRMLDAPQFIIREAAKYRILLINELHNRPQHRLFTKSLLQRLHAIGYNVFMAEGIRLKNDLANRTYPVRSDGTFLSEPTYASLLRYAHKTGYTIHAYEPGYEKKADRYWDDSIKLDQFGSIKYISHEPRDSMTLLFDEKGLKMTIMTSVRERSQADNILQVIKAHPSSKFIIHVGNGHLFEDGSMMGAKLRALLKGEDVLTIDQVGLNDRIPVVDTMVHHSISRPFSFVLQDSITGRYFNTGMPVDYMVFSKNTGDSLQRPSFLFEDVEKRTIYYPPLNMLKDCPCLLSAYYQDEYDKEGDQTIAIDVVHTRDNSRPVPLLLYKGKYIILKKDHTGKYDLFKATIN